MSSLKRYCSFLVWLFSDALLRFKGFSLLVLLSGFLGVLFQVQAFGVALYYAKHFSSGEAFTTSRFGLDIHLDPRTSLPLLAAMGVGILVSLLLSAGAIYLSRWGNVRLNRRYIEVCTRRALELLSGSRLAIADYEGEGYAVGSDQYFMRLIVGDCKLGGRVLRMLLEMTVPAITLCVAFAGLVYIEPKLTAIIMLCMVFFLSAQSRISRRAADHSIKYEQYAPLANRRCKDLLREYKRLPPGSDPDIQALDRFIHTGPFMKQLDAYVGRIRSVYESRLVSGMFMAAMLALILLYMGREIIGAGVGWGRLLVYLVAARAAMTGLQGVFGHLTGINRFYPQVMRYARFVKSYAEQDGDCDCGGGLEVFMKEGGPWGGTKALALAPGGRLAVAGTLPLNRYTAPTFLSGLTGRERGVARGVAFVAHDPACPNLSPGEWLGMPRGEGWDCLGLPPHMVRRLEEGLPQGADRKLWPKTWDRLDPELRFLLALLASLRSGSGLVLVDESGLRSLGRECLDALAPLAEEAVLALVYKGRFKRVGRYGEQAVAVLDGDRLLGLGDLSWFEDVCDQVEAAPRPGVAPSGTATPEDDDLDDEF